MGNDLRNNREKRAGSGGSNAAGNVKRLGKIKEARGQFDLSRLNTARLLTVIGVALEGGGAIRIGLTRDGGAVAVGVYSDGESETVYLNASDDQDAFWENIENVFRD